MKFFVKESLRERCVKAAHTPSVARLTEEQIQPYLLFKQRWYDKERRAAVDQRRSSSVQRGFSDRKGGDRSFEREWG
jgi:hypothetical protein